MSFDNHYYPNRKDWRKPHTKSKRFDRSCRCHGSCGYCKGNRFHNIHRSWLRGLDDEELRLFPYKQDRI